MATLQYTHSLTGNGVGSGLPLKPGSEMYNVDPMVRYPLVLSPGTSAETGKYTEGIFLRNPHQPVMGEIAPYVNNHKAGGTFLRPQYFTIKRGDAVQVHSPNQASVGYFKANQALETSTYGDPSKFARPRIKAYDDGGGEITVAAFLALSPAAQEPYEPVYERETDTNDRIATGGRDFTVELEMALLGNSASPEFVKVDIEQYYGGNGPKADGFMSLSTGGFDVTRFFSARDVEAQVTLPARKSDDADFVAAGESRLVKELTVSDVSMSNVANWEESAVFIPAANTPGVAHTDLEQALNLQNYNFRTGLDLSGYLRKGRMRIPFVDIEKLKTLIDADGTLTYGTDFNFTDQTEERSGLKVGVDLEGATDYDVVNKYSLLTSADDGYAHLVYNFWAPFATFTSAPMIGDVLVPDLFGKYVKKGSGAVIVGATADVDGDENAFDLDADGVSANEDGSMTVSDSHAIGYIETVRTIEKPDIIDQVVSPMWQARISNGITRQIDHGYNRVTGASTAGIAPMLSDFCWMLLGGSARDWATGFMPTYNGRRQDLAYVVEELVYEGALGVLEVILDASTSR